MVALPVFSALLFSGQFLPLLCGLEKRSQRPGLLICPCESLADFGRCRYALEAIGWRHKKTPTRLHCLNTRKSSRGSGQNAGQNCPFFWRLLWSDQLDPFSPFVVFEIHVLDVVL